ncbi:hypothetical protein HD599_001101 [Conyzicola lurida]|uniref:Integral membrane bound transporter domain-containing protein n=1 Tax=Conyzicola lurida TaxID=1172621 RepID=A0A841AKA8_9MICO|nr:hypothetical protein [Conyzicola lurida]
MSIRTDIRSLFELRPSPVRWPIALQAAVAVGIPTVGFSLAGRSDLGLLASTGGFLALYLTGRSRQERAAKLPFVAAGLVASAALGVLASGSLLGSLLAVFVIAAVSATLCLGLAVGPPGALFFVLVGGVATHLAGPTNVGGAGIDGALIIGLLVLGCVVSYAVVLSPLLLPSVRRRDAAVHETRVPMRFVFDGISRVILTRLVLASALAVAVAVPLGLPRAYWVVLTVVVILQNGHTVRLSALRAVHRVLGTFVGLGLFALIALFAPEGLWLAFVLMALQFVTETVIVRNYGLALIFITPLALLISTQGGHVDEIIADRVLDTLVGTAIALVVLIGAVALRRIRPARDAPGAAA